MSTKPAPKKRTHQIWTPKEVNRLQQLLRKRTSADEIGKLLKRSGKSIRRKAEILGLSYAIAYNHNRVAAKSRTLKNGHAAKKNGAVKNGTAKNGHKTKNAPKRILPKAKKKLAASRKK